MLRNKRMVGVILNQATKMGILFKKLSIGLTAVSVCSVALAQSSAHTVENPSDTNTLQHIFKSGTFTEHARYFVMGTNNRGALTDYLTNAIGVGIGFESGVYKHLSFGLSGYFIYNLGSHNLTKVDPATGTLNRYEIGLYDIENPSNKHDLDRLEDLYIKYTRKKLSIKAGKQHVKQPFITPQDGRMRPTLVEGVTLLYQPNNRIKIEAGYLFGISPRSTVKWFGIGESIGVYPSGVNQFGNKSSYAGNISSDAIYVAGITYTPIKKIQLYGFNQWVNQVFNTSLVQTKYEIELKPKHLLEFNLQGIHQVALANGGNIDPKLSYLLKNHQSFTFGARVNYVKNDQTNVALNYNRITKHGQYLMPREWGRDPFFTFLPRERNEGFADVHAANISISYKWPKQRLKIECAYGRYYLPDVKNAWQNKYGMPSYSHTMLDIKYAFRKFFKGLDMEVLYIYKEALGNTYQNNKYVINKVDMSNLNIIFNYHF